MIAVKAVFRVAREVDDQDAFRDAVVATLADRCIVDPDVELRGDRLVVVSGASHARTHTYAAEVIDRAAFAALAAADRAECALLGIALGVCTGYQDDGGRLAHDGDTCPTHEEGSAHA